MIRVVEVREDKQVLNKALIFGGLGLAWILSNPHAIWAEAKPQAETEPQVGTEPAETEPQAEIPQNFAEWCARRESLPAAAKRTVSVILQQVGTYNCDRASETLSTITHLDLSTSQLIDLTPLQSLESLNSLRLINNQISDLSPLAPLKKLTVLDLSYNQISNVAPLKSLENLRALNLSYNNISDVEPLNSLSDLNELNLNNNNITSIGSLKSLESLTYLFLRGNPIADRTCPINPKYICQFQSETSQET
ncbi:MAG: leucine-rich repeat domain-containing protein [Oscillatoriales cyanobacterium RM1_1_9]|nr:leucine-rich repeat domain-containing protein [Oscillatoriales cyanobacterium SM2_3_0]NJO46452.1 leucine-rich repeat domain-containing protein [Oscillatoriales cyanobacterium RM2_1_1]NJO71159.1 leucine-rich repeat domain-containing protein [Oscillatoriales cyanobacterium RM1_1_9]